MCKFSQSLLGLVLGPIIAACGGSNLTLPDDSAPARLQAVSGDGQEGTVGSRLDEPLVARLTDASGQPVGGIPVDFQFQGAVADAELDPSTTATDGDGRASAEVRLGADTGSVIVEARVAEASTSNLRTTFDLTAVAREGNRGRGGHDD
jgi:hypothetical protein